MTELPSEAGVAPATAFGGDSDEPVLDAETHYSITASDVCCGIGLGLGIIASYVFIGLTPSLLAHHGILLEALAGTNAAIVSGGALARVGRDSLVLVIAAPVCTIALYDVFYWWAGRLWGTHVAEFYARNNPRMGRWIERAERMVRRGGIWTLAVGYYLPIPNYIIFLSCGTSGMPLWTFLLGDLIGLMLWEALLVGLGWAIGHPAVHVIDQIGHYSLRITIAVVVIIVIVATVRGRRASRRSRLAKAE
jgi:membrane protein DedA with SNARE-associated domain